MTHVTTVPGAGALGEDVYVYEDIGFVCISVADLGDDVIQLDVDKVEPFIEAIRKAREVQLGE